ncbi:hypothetical protein [Acinetobacter sp. ANC 3813]|uniref:hypothetical protein n=1 Tax=Acinetobacter sp. ANC 3813 TaxID=1977873 RepID=UPI000A350BE1|nr:hypothetical protein [Acinetobacter sp. ANC 3813]OTG87887.1 hypothetical protein B9T34_16260 [Acinetobacter sp. ANC 3813]
MTKDVSQEIKTAAMLGAVTAKFLGLMGYGKPLASGTVSYGAQYDSIVANALEHKFRKEALIPEPLLQLEKALEGKVGADGSRAFNAILDSINIGVEAHRNRNGGDMPHANLVATALLNAAQQYTLGSNETDGIFDSASNTNHSAKEYFLDSVSSQQSGHAAEVPTLAMVTIATTIANALPLVAYLPNPKGSQTVPLVYVRQIAANNYGQTRKGDFLDGVTAAKQFFDSVHRLEMTSADQKTFTVKAYRCVESGTLTPDAGSGDLPLVAGATFITIAGQPFATDEHKNQTSGKASGTLPIYPQDHDGLVLDGETYKLVSGTVDFSTNTVTITLDKALPADVKVVSHVIANYEAKDGNNKAILPTPSVDADLDYGYVSAYGIRAIYVATIDALTQMQNELGVDMRAAFIAVVISKLMLEQNVSLLQQARERAVGGGMVRVVDLSRGSSMTQAFNRTADLAGELIPAVEESKRRIIGRTNHTPEGFDIFVTGSLGTLVRTLADDTNFIPSGLTLGAPNSIVRIGSRGTDHYYYVPEEAEVVEFGSVAVGGAQIQFSEMLITARNSVAAKSVFVGHIAVPVVTGDVRAQVFEEGVTFYTRQACQMNRNKRFGDQVAVLRVQNLPASLTQDA